MIAVTRTAHRKHRFVANEFGKRGRLRHPAGSVVVSGLFLLLTVLRRHHPEHVRRKPLAQAGKLACRHCASAFEMSRSLHHFDQMQRIDDSRVKRLRRLTFTLCSGDDSTALRVTSEPVPAVVGMATNGADGFVNALPGPMISR